MLGRTVMIWSIVHQLLTLFNTETPTGRAGEESE